MSRPIRTFDSKPEPRSFFKVCIRSFAAAWESRFIIRSLFTRDLKAEYRKSLLGVLWIFLPPLFSAAIWIILNDQKIIEFDGMDISYPVFALCGTIFWQSFVGGVNNTLMNFRQLGPLRSKLLFNVEAIMYSAVAKTIFNTGMRVITLVPALLILGVDLQWTMLLAPIPIFMLILLGFGFGLLVTPIASLYDDVERTIQYGLQALFFLTPVIYPVVNDGWFARWLKINPIAHLLNLSRDLIVTGQLTYLEGSLWAALFAFGLMLIAIYFVKLTLFRIVERI